MASWEIGLPRSWYTALSGVPDRSLTWSSVLKDDVVVGVQCSAVLHAPAK